jgi:hypothetical protein
MTESRTYFHINLAVFRRQNKGRARMSGFLRLDDIVEASLLTECALVESTRCATSFGKPEW